MYSEPGAQDSDASEMSEADELMIRVFSQEGADDPHPVYQEMHAKCPVSIQPGVFGSSNSILLTKYDEVLWALKHPEVFSSKDVVQIGGEYPLIPLSVDPPDHAKYRRMFDPEFSPQKMAALEPEFRKFVNETIDGFIDQGEVNFHEAFASPLPSTFFLALTGLPHEDLPQFLQWRDDSIRPAGATEAEQTRVRTEAGDAIQKYFEEKLEEKRRNPDDRLFSRMVNGEVDGRPLTHAELLGACHLLLLAGLDTVTATLDCMIVYLAQHPDRRDALVANAELVTPAVEDLLRHQTPVQMVPRLIAQEFTAGGCTVKAGDTATLMIGAANVDVDQFDSATEVLFDREANRHLAFGGGAHRCLGSHLARLELRVAIEEFHRRIPDYELANDDVHFSIGIRQSDNVPLRFTPGR